MTRIAYIKKSFSASSLEIIRIANAIVADLKSQGYDLTLRQLYYQFVSRDVLPNTQQSYKRLGDIVNNGRLAGLIDWEAIEDRTRNLRKNPHWDNPAGVIKSAADSYGIDLWKGQEHRVEVWVEKDALIGILERACDELDVSYFSCRGYTSQSELWGAAQRHRGYMKAGQRPVVLHLGDHDPSGIDMSRDIEDRLHLFGARTIVRRIALTMDQVDQYSPPPNPAKQTDARFASYAAEHGDESWELDALAPKVIDDLIREQTAEFLDQEMWDERHELQEKGRELLRVAAAKWDDVVEFLEQE